MMIDISFIIPAYNVEGYIHRTLDSLVCQCGSICEIIIVDDGSTDGTAMVVGQFIKKYDFISYYKINNSGVSAARNLGIEKSRGKYLIFVDGDDWFSSNLVGAYLNSTKNEDVYFWDYMEVSEDFCDVLDWNKKILCCKGRYLINDFMYDVINRKIKINMATFMFKKSLILNHGIYFSKDLINGEDLEFYFKVLLNVGVIERLPNVLMYYLLRNGSVTNSYNPKKIGAIYALKSVAASFFTAKNYSLAHVFSGKLFVEHFHAYFISSVKMLKAKKTPSFDIIQKILNDINLYEIKKNIKIFNFQTLKTIPLSQIIMIYIFLMSPRFYLTIIMLKYV